MTPHRNETEHLKDIVIGADFLLQIFRRDFGAVVSPDVANMLDKVQADCHAVTRQVVLADSGFDIDGPIPGQH